MKEMKAIWAKLPRDQKNVTCAFLLDLPAGDAVLRIAAGNLYRVFAENRLIGSGPARAAHGCARVDEWRLPNSAEPLSITVEVVSYAVNNYYFVNEPPFIALEAEIDGKIVDVGSLDCVLLNDRVTKVQRYSFQRPFAEAYRMKRCRSALYLRQGRSDPETKFGFPVLQTEEASSGKLLPRGTAYPHFERQSAQEIETGSLFYDPIAPKWINRSVTAVGRTLGGFLSEEFEERLSDQASALRFAADGVSGAFQKGRYATFDFGRTLSGFLALSVEAEEDCEILVLFDEIISRTGDGLRLDPFRNECCNVLKWKLAAGTYDLTAFEAYCLRFARVCVLEGSLKLKRMELIRFENPEASRFSIRVGDGELEEIFEAARNSYAQNSVDLLMDCPSRERAGWTNDNYFTGDADQLFSGRRRAERNYLENLALAPALGLPEGMTPMCYPCDHPDGNYIPNCGIWYALSLFRYAVRSGDQSLADNCRSVFSGMSRYFKLYENSDGLLEDLEGWVFVEWSKANDCSHVSGVNYPSNMMYYAFLKIAGELFGEESYRLKAERVRRAIIEQSFNGEFFEDNRLRKEGLLVPTGNVTEACQYYAFFFDVARGPEFAKLKRTVIDEFGVFRSPEFRPEIERAGLIIGLCMRESLLLEAGELGQLVSECRRMFLHMAERTATIWEHLDARASCNHGIGACAAVWLCGALTGFLGVEDGSPVFSDQFLGVDCDAEIPVGDTILRVRVREGVRTVEKTVDITE